MPRCDLIDTFPLFVNFWDRAQRRSLDVQVELWLTDYMSQWPELAEKQQADYAGQGIEWQAVARGRVFPFLPDRLPLMVEARQNLLACFEPVYQRAQTVLGLDFDVIFVIYVGIGCGAGWATSLRGVPACLFGLENMAECGWTDREALASLTAHELGHLLHQQWRTRHGLIAGEGPFWQLYEEGFAQRCEHIIMGKDTWHEQDAQDGWLAWCDENRAWLAAEFLTIVDQQKPANPFFGSWYDIQGRRQCGYFLGHELIKEWEGEIDLKEIALLPWDEVQQRARNSLEKMVRR